MVLLCSYKNGIVMYIQKWYCYVHIKMVLLCTYKNGIVMFI